jgi:hypothetical protein
LRKETIYVHDNVQREEFVGFVEAPFNPRRPAPHMAVITHCDTGVVDQLDLDDHEYREVKMERYPDEKQFTRKLEQAQRDDQKHAVLVGSGFPMLPGLVNSGTIQLTLIYDWFLPSGLAIEEKSTQSQSIRVDGVLRGNRFQLQEKVLELSEEPLDPALFEVPAGFKKVRALYQHEKTSH